MLLLFFLTKNHDRVLNENRYVIKNSKQSGDFPDIDVEVFDLANVNDTDEFIELVKAKYNDVRVSGVQATDTKLNLKEEENYQTCVKNGVRDRQMNGSKFWAVEQIRRTHHTYLAKEDAVLMEVGGL